MVWYQLDQYPLEEHYLSACVTNYTILSKIKFPTRKKTRLKHSSQTVCWSRNQSKQIRMERKTHTKTNKVRKQTATQFIRRKRPRAIRLSQRKRNFWNYLHDKQKQGVNKKKERYKQTLQGITELLNMEFERFYPTKTSPLSIHSCSSLRFFYLRFLRWAIS